MQSAEYYRKKAAELRLQASGVSTQMLKEQFLKIAQEYDGLAAEVDGDHPSTTSR